MSDLPITLQDCERVLLADSDIGIILDALPPRYRDIVLALAVTALCMGRTQVLMEQLTIADDGIAAALDRQK